MDRGTCFESIESAHEFLALLSEVVKDAKQAIDGELSAATDPRRRDDALKIARYNLEKLETHVSRSVRILNDLRSLHRLLFGERTQGAAKPALVKPVAEKPATVFVPPPLAQVASVKAVRKSVPAA